MKTVQDAINWANRGEPPEIYIAGHPKRTQKALRILAEKVKDSSYPLAIFCGNDVYHALSEKAKARTSPENVADVLDAVADLIRADLQKR